jgi:hypothetical protein
MALFLLGVACGFAAAVPLTLQVIIFGIENKLRTKETNQ